MDGGHGKNQFHGLRVHQGTGPPVPACSLQVEAFDPNSILKVNIKQRISYSHGFGLEGRSACPVAAGMQFGEV